VEDERALAKLTDTATRLDVEGLTPFSGDVGDSAPLCSIAERRLGHVRAEGMFAQKVRQNQEAHTLPRRRSVC